MKTVIILLGALIVAPIRSPAGSAPSASAAQSILGAQPWPLPEAMEGAGSARYEWVGKHFTISGIAVRLLKGGHPLQLVNPAAPEDYGSGFEYLDPGSSPRAGRDPGWKLLSIEF